MEAVPDSVRRLRTQVYEYGPAPEFSRAAWTTVKASQTHSFPNLPYLIDEEVTLVQSMAILRVSDAPVSQLETLDTRCANDQYIARKYGPGKGLCCEGGSPSEQANFDMLLEQAIDLRNAVARCAYGAMFQSFFAGPCTEQLGLWERFFAARAGSPWVTGAVLTVADFVLAEALDHVSTMAKEQLDRDLLSKYPAVAAFLARFQAVPGASTQQCPTPCCCPRL